MDATTIDTILEQAFQMKRKHMTCIYVESSGDGDEHVNLKVERKRQRTLKVDAHFWIFSNVLTCMRTNQECFVSDQKNVQVIVYFSESGTWNDVSPFQYSDLLEESFGVTEIN